MGYRQNHAEFDGSRNGGRGGGGGGRRHDHAEDNGALEAAGTRPSHHNPTGQFQRDRHGDREASEDNERHGDLRRGRGDRIRNRSDEAYEHPDLRPSRGLIGGGRTPQDDGTSQEQQGRFIPYAFRMLHPEDVKFLVKVFKVRTSKVKEWCEADHIRMDNSRNFETNIDPLLSTLTSGDRELYAKALQRKQNEKEIRKIVGWGSKHAMTAFDRGYEAGQTSIRREHKAERHGQS